MAAGIFLRLAAAITPHVTLGCNLRLGFQARCHTDIGLKCWLQKKAARYNELANVNGV